MYPDCLLVFSTSEHTLTPRGTNFVYELVLAINKERQIEDVLNIVVGVRHAGFNVEVRSSLTKKLYWRTGGLAPGFMRQVFRSLKDNPSIKKLVIDGWEGLDNDMFKDLMESLQVNTNLEAISLERTSWKLDGKEATIEQALRRKNLLKRQVAYVDVLTSPKAGRFFCGLGAMELTSPKAGRLILCGFEFAGKTTLRKSMIRSWLKSQCPIWMPSFVTDLSVVKSRRTEGTEIEMLRNDNTMQISIWDLAGQDKFRALQSVLFPSISQACVFLFVFSCYNRDTKEVKSKKNLDEELRHWMRFIASNSSSQGHILPQVFVILSHLDKMPQGTNLVEWAEQTITLVGKDFVGLFNISSQVFALKSSSTTSVTPVLDTVFQLFEDLLFKKLKLVPEPCNRMNTVLGRWRSKHPARPMMPLQEFHDLCFKKVPELANLGKQDAIEILEAIASYLHDVGSIMFFKKARVVVVNPNWVSHVFLGSLIGVEPGQNQRSSNMLPSTSDGLIAKSQVESTLAHFLKDNNYKDLNMEDLIGLMLELELCCEVEVDGVTHYLVPHTLKDVNGNARSGRRQLQWPLSNLGSDYLHMGCRLQCNDQLKTYLGLGFFSRFQVCLRNRLFARKPEMGAQQYGIELNLIIFFADGVEILVEIPGDVGDYVDILVRSNKSREQTRAFVWAHVVDEMRSFCASPEGSQGVTLAEGIIRPECVSHLTLCVYRRGQAVLKQKLIERVENRFINTECGEIFPSSIDYDHIWEGVPKAQLCGRFQMVLELLEAEDILDVLAKNKRSVQQKLIVVEEATRSVQQKLIAVEEAAQEVLGKSHGEDHVNHSCATFTRTMSSSAHRASHQEVLQQDIREIKGQLYDIKGQLYDIKSLQEQMLKAINVLQDRTLVTVACKMDAIMNFSAQLINSDVPSRPYFTTDDVDKVHKLVAGIEMRKAMMLHFMCEDTRGPHLVEGQVGLKLTAVDAKWKWIQPIALQSARMLVFLVKAGLHVAAGIGSVVPDFAEWSGAIPLTAAAQAGETLLDNINLQVVGSSMEQSKCVEEAWVLMRDEVKPHLVGQMGTLFQLYKVQFVGGPQRRVGWVCQKCLQRGISKRAVLPL